MTRPDDLVRLLRAGESARPRLIWHAPGERIELSGRVLATWVSKAADLLQEELDAEVGTRVRLDGPPHWRMLVWALATWTVGGTVLTDASADTTPSDPVDVLVTDGTRIGAGSVDLDVADHVVALTLPALARRSPVALPPGVLDDAAILLSHADEMEPLDRAEDDDPALDGITYADLIGAGTTDRLHVTASADLTTVLRHAADAWAAGGSIVLTDPAWEAEHGDDPTAGSFADTLTQEGVSAPRA